MNIYSVILLCITAALIAVYFIDRFTKHKMLLAVIQWRPVLIALSSLVSAIAAVLPSQKFALLSIVLNAASDATQKAEELYRLNELPKYERNDYAQLLIAKTLQEAGIEVTDQIQEIIDGCIAVVCMLMPHGVVVDPIDSVEIAE